MLSGHLWQSILSKSVSRMDYLVFDSPTLLKWRLLLYHVLTIWIGLLGVGSINILSYLGRIMCTLVLSEIILSIIWLPLAYIILVYHLFHAIIMIINVGLPSGQQPFIIFRGLLALHLGNQFYWSMLLQSNNIVQKIIVMSFDHTTIKITCRQWFCRRAHKLKFLILPNLLRWKYILVWGWARWNMLRSHMIWWWDMWSRWVMLST